MARMPYVLFDTAQPTTVANAVHTLFQVSQGGDATHVKSFTNMRGAGSLPDRESFEFWNIGIIQDEDMTQADLEAFWFHSFVEIFIMDQSIIRVPGQMAARGNAWSGTVTESTATLDANTGLMGNGYEMRMPIAIKDGESFRVELQQGAALSAPMDIKVVLDGILDRT